MNDSVYCLPLKSVSGTETLDRSGHD